jgi:hypothetical protein
MRFAWLPLVACATLWSARQAEAAPLLVDWQTPACAVEGAFRARVRDALRREPESVLEQELSVGVQITENHVKTGYLLQVRTDAGVRQLELPSCEEAVAAAATLVALTIDPNAVAPPAAAPAEPPPEPKRAPTRPPAPARPAARIEPYVAAFGGVSLGEVPAPSPLFGGGFGLRLRGFGVGAEGFWIAPQTELLPGTNKGGQVGLLGGGLALCYSPLRDALSISGCLAGQAGAWRSRGVVTNPTEQTDWWLAGVARLGAGARLTSSFRLFVNGDLVLPARTPLFKLEDLGGVFRPNRVGGRVFGGVELGF